MYVGLEGKPSKSAAGLQLRVNEDTCILHAYILAHLSIRSSRPLDVRRLSSGGRRQVLLARVHWLAFNQLRGTSAIVIIYV